MYKRKPKAILPKKKSAGDSTTAVHSMIDESKFTTATKTTSNRWPNIDSYLSGDDNNSRTTSSSWPEEIEQLTTNKVLNLWYNVERFIYREDKDNEDLAISGHVLDECIQWRTQIPHFRIVGKLINKNSNDSEITFSSTSSSRNRNVNSADTLQQKELKRQQTVKNKEKVIDEILQYIYTELNNNDENDEEIIDDINQLLKIKPAPTYNKKLIKPRKKSANLYKSFELTERINTSGSIKSFKNLNIEHVDNLNNLNKIMNRVEDEDEDDTDSQVLKLSRNKLGTVFTKKVVVSPVPFAVSTRESFCTLKTTPIRYAGHLLELSTPQGSSKSINFGSKVNSAQRKSLDKLSQRSGTWQTPVYPSVWPKNVKLAPIDPTRLPSSKRRSAVISTDIPQRNRNSLSPILRPLKSTPASHTFNSDDFLVVEGKNHIVTRSNLLKIKDYNFNNKHKRK